MWDGCRESVLAGRFSARLAHMTFVRKCLMELKRGQVCSSRCGSQFSLPLIIVVYLWPDLRESIGAEHDRSTFLWFCPLIWPDWTFSYPRFTTSCPNLLVSSPVGRSDSQPVIRHLTTKVDIEEIFSFNHRTYPKTARPDNSDR